MSTPTNFELEDAASDRYVALRGGRGGGALAVTFGLSYLLLIAGPPLLGQASAPYPLLSTGEILDLVTPLVLIPLTGLLYVASAPWPPNRLALIGFVALSIVWVQGQAIHLAANAIGHYVGDTGNDLQTLVVFLDEELSHVMWHASVIGLAGMTIHRSARAPAERPASGSTAAVVLGGVLFGVTYFLMVVEGRTWGFGLPAAAVAAGVGLMISRGRPLQRQALGLYVVGAVVALGLSTVWAAMNDWQLLEFSQVWGF